MDDDQFESVCDRMLLDNPILSSFSFLDGFVQRLMERQFLTARPGIPTMMNTAAVDEQNLLHVSTVDDVDRTNARFYGKFPFPWRPLRLERALDGDLERALLCQAIGDWRHRAIPSRPRIWVAGCGTNQAVITALTFPDATVLGTDISQASLDVCARTAEELSVTNLELRPQSLNAASDREAFDYIICTGVIHHNADPGLALRRLSAALKPGGILELMVYNRFHRILSSAFQKAIRILAGTAPEPGSDTEMQLASSLSDTFPTPCLMERFLKGRHGWPPAKLADALLQPVEYSYTVESLQRLVASCDLEIAAPCLNTFDRADGKVSWNLRFGSDDVQRRYDALDDLERWHVTNLLLCESSPMLWFYLRRTNGAPRPPSERDICREFLETHFTSAHTMRQEYVLGRDGSYKAFEPIAYPPPPGDRRLRGVVADADGKVPAAVLLHRHGLPTTFPEVNDIRIQLTTPLFPYLKARR
jgi:SAM-dependent methyltransferase